MERTATRSESLLRPREIQVRIRAGQSPETVAAAAQTTVDRVMAYATPVLAERAFVAQQAAKASVRRRAGDGPVGRLGEAVAARLESAGLTPDAADWDAWRREDGRWTVVAEYVEGGESQRAEFTYDAMGRYVIAEDDLARWLVGERRTPEPAPLADPDPEPTTGQLALGDDALQVVTGRSLSAVTTPAVLAATGLPARLVGATEPTEDLTETARAVRAAGAPAPVASALAPAVAPAPAAVVAPAAPPAAGSGPVEQDEAPAPSVPAQGDALFEDDGLRTSPEPATERRTPRPANGARNRRSMPSWDDIMLGSAPRGD